MKRLSVQAAILAAIAAGTLAEHPGADAAPPPNCQSEAVCGFKKPLMLFVLDYSTSMNLDFAGQGSRWANAVAAVQQVMNADNGHVASHYVLGVMRFGHDPDAAPGTKIPGDTSGLVDGVKLDVPFFTDDVDDEYNGCDQNDLVAATLAAVPPPLNGQQVGIGTWTRGALQFARDYFATTLAAHPADALNPQRLRSIVLITDGRWTNAKNTSQLSPPAEDPTSTAAALYEEDGIPTHVIALGQAFGEPFADALAAAAGTTAARSVATPEELTTSAKQVAMQIFDTQVVPQCALQRPRVMILLDASSSMLNLEDDLTRASLNEGGWELARQSLAGDDSIFETHIEAGEVEDLVDLGLSVFGGPDEAKLMIQYGPCTRDRFAWALDPLNSCGDGCDDPYAAAPISWTYQDGSLVAPMFDKPTLSHAPRCDELPEPSTGCTGSSAAIHLGLAAVQTNLDAYKAACSQPTADQPCNAVTPFHNIVIVDGPVDSAAAQYAPPLQQMLDNGVTTHFIGFGSGADDPLTIAALTDMAALGSNGQHPYHDADDQAGLETALADILDGLNSNPCCSNDQCSDTPPPDESDTDTDTDSDTTTDSDETSPPLDTSSVTTDDSTTTDPLASTTSTTDPEPTPTTSTTTTTDPPASTTSTTSTTTDPGPATLPTTGYADDTTASSTSTAATTGQSPPQMDPSEGDCNCDARGDSTPALAALLLLLLRRRRS